jgi:hypothetical protein
MKWVTYRSSSPGRFESFMGLLAPVVRLARSSDREILRMRVESSAVSCPPALIGQRGLCAVDRRGVPPIRGRGCHDAHAGRPR